MTWTKHGHYIPGTTTLGQGKQPLVARCGGIGLCDKCTKEAVNIGWKPDSVAKDKVKETYEMVKDEAPLEFEDNSFVVFGEGFDEDRPPHTETDLRTDKTVIMEYLTDLRNDNVRRYEDVYAKLLELKNEAHLLQRMISELEGVESVDH